MSRYWLESRSNSALTVIDEVSDFEELTVRLRFNGLSTWTLTLRRESSYAPTFLPDSNKALNNGLLLWFDPEDGITAPILLLSGPEDTYELSRKEDGTGTLLVNGYDDNVWLQWRLALPTPNYPYLTSWPKGTNYPAGIAGPLRWYALNDTSGTTATDSSDSPHNGTYNGGFTLNQPGLIDDPSPCALFNGTTGFVSVPTTGLPGGNTPWFVLGWGMLTANPTANGHMWAFGTNAAGQDILLGVNTAGFPFVGGNGLTTITGATAVPLNQPFLLAAGYDGTTLTGYLNGVAFGSSTPGVLNITYGICNLGANLSGGAWPGYLGMGGFFNTTLGQNLIFSRSGNIYITGLSRQAFLPYDNNNLLPFANASTGLIYYVQRNASTTASPYPAYGSVQPQATFTSVQGTRYALTVPNLVCASDPQAGSKVYAAARFDKLPILLAAIAVQSNPEIGFRVVQVGQQLQFQTYLPTDKTATAVFSLDLGNLRSYTWQYGRSTANYIFTGGLNPSTSLQSRTFGEAGDATAIGQFGVICDFYDYRKTQDTVTLANVMQAKLAELRARRNINAAINDTTNLYFGGPGNKGYNLGDKVRVVMEDGNVYDDICREVDITLTKGQPAKVTAAIGTPIDAAILSEFDAIAKRFKDDGINIDLVQNNY